MVFVTVSESHQIIVVVMVKLKVVMENVLCKLTKVITSMNAVYVKDPVL